MHACMHACTCACIFALPACLPACLLNHEHEQQNSMIQRQRKAVGGNAKGESLLLPPPASQSRGSVWSSSPPSPPNQSKAGKSSLPVVFATTKKIPLFFRGTNTRMGQSQPSSLN
ncbi:hypothetical protein F5B18DRAFT_32740 [Nemania serpens]|nr:hypothetical protein F5B18DRAFT_32740 [Nemania serpens]